MPNLSFVSAHIDRYSEIFYIKQDRGFKTGKNKIITAETFDI